MQLIECVPNISEGKNQDIIKAITGAIIEVPSVKLLDVDSGSDTNRTVITFVADPKYIVEAAFQLIAKATSTIDMTKHQGVHPAMGSVDVCPFVPLANTSMQECNELAKLLAKRVGQELKIPVYLYGESAQISARQDLFKIRQNGYIGLKGRLANPLFKPDEGPIDFNPITGATALGARKILIAYNINLNTRSINIANHIATSIRESGSYSKDVQGKVLRTPGLFKACKAIGWYIEEYQCAQVSINLTDYKITSLHDVFNECCRLAKDFGAEVTGSQIIGLTPLEALLKAGHHYFLKANSKQTSLEAISDENLVQLAIDSLGLSTLNSFDPKKKIIEYRLSNMV